MFLLIATYTTDRRADGRTDGRYSCALLDNTMTFSNIDFQHKGGIDCFSLNCLEHLNEIEHAPRSRGRPNCTGISVKENI